MTARSPNGPRFHLRRVAAGRTWISSQSTPGYAIALVAGTSLLVYLNSLLNGFVFDDVGQVLLNPWIRDFRHLPDIFSENVWAFDGQATNYYRPTMHVIYMLVYSAFGPKAWGFHLANVLLHSATSVLVLMTASRVFGEVPRTDRAHFRSPSFIAAMLFAVHPIHTEPVAWIAGVPELAFSFFFVLSFFLYIRSKGDGNEARAPYVASVLSYFLATLSKETALTLPFFLVAYDLLLGNPKTIFSAKSFRRYVPYVVATAVYLAMRYHALGGMAPVKAEVAPSQALGFIDIFVLLTKYCAKLVLPTNLNALHIYRPAASVFDAMVAGSVLSAVVLGFLMVIAFKKNKTALLALLFVVVPLTPAFYFPGLNFKFYNSFAERYLYLPTFGFVLLLSLAIAWITTHRSASSPFVAMAFISLIVIYSSGSIHRTSVWKDELTLWADAVRKSPDSALAHHNLGTALRSQGKIDDAIGHFQEAARLQPEIAYFRNSLGDGYHRKGRTDQAIEQYQIAIALQPDEADAYNNLGSALAETGSLDRAITYFETAVRLQPHRPDYHYNLGVAYIDKGLAGKAIAHLEYAARRSPDDAGFRDTLERAYRILAR